MPHKHKRRKLDDGAAYVDLVFSLVPSPAQADLNSPCHSFDLPPTSIARALPAFQKPPKNANGPPTNKNTDSKPAKSKKKTKRKAPVDDDTPKSFARLLQFHTLGKRLPKGLDDGNAPPSKQKKKDVEGKKHKLDSSNTTTVPEPTPAEPNLTIPKILPGERLSDFAARVDQALPLSGLRSTDKQRAAKVPGLQERTTKHNKRLARMQAEWREAERRRKEKREEEMDELEDVREEHGLLWNGVASTSKKKKRRRGNDDDDEDPWKALEKAKADAKQRNLQDVVQAPPQLVQVTSKFKEVVTGGGGGGVGVDVGNVPGRVGSLRKREAVGAVRREVIDAYRRKMARTGR